MAKERKCGYQRSRGCRARTRGGAWNTYRAQRTFGSLDGLRALCILAVIWHHTHPGISGPLQAFSMRGFLGVDLFFCISGYLIVTLLLRERQHTGDISLKHFYIRRVLRIFPLYYATLGFVAAMAWWAPGNQSLHMRHDLAYAALYLSNWVAMSTLLSVTWSLSAEEQFYLVWPVMERCARRLLMPLLLVLLLALIGLQLGHAHFGLFAGLPEFLAQTSFVPILLGVALAHLLHDRRGFELAFRAVGGHLAAPLAMGLLILLTTWPVEDISGIPRLCMTLAMILLLASCVLREDHALASLLQWRPLAFVGTVSYGMYLIHMLTRHVAVKLLAKLGWVNPDAPDGLPLFVFTLGFTLVAAAVSYRWFESYFLGWKARLTHQSPA